MMLEFTVGINMAGKRGSVTVAAEDTLTIMWSRHSRRIEPMSLST
jgi:hypothetical protein